MTIPGISGTPPLLVGREREQGILRDRLAAALAGQGSLVLIGGEAGIGKTALAEALCREADEQGATVLIGRCFDLAETPPYGPWRYLFDGYPDYATSPDRPPAFARRGSVGAVSDQGALFQQVRDCLEQLTTQHPTILLLDDLHWSDPASLDLLRFLAQAVTRLPLLILATYRSDELTHHHPLYQLLPRLVREANAERVEVRPLADAAVQALVRTQYALPATETDRLVAYLSARSEGNALFLGELLRSLEEADVLRRGETGWTLGDMSRVAIPMLLRQVIDGRVARLEAESQRLLAVAAVIGYQVPLAIWAAVGETDEDALLDVVERGAEARLLIELPDGEQVQFAHALIREALYEGIPATRRRRLHRTIGEALVATRDPDPDAVANHFRRAVDVRAAEWLAKAGFRARFAFSWRTAVERFEAALALYDAHNLDVHERVRILAALAYCYRFIDHQRALAYFAEVEQAAERLHDRLVLLSVLGGRAWTQQDVGHLREGLDDMLAARAIVETVTAEERVEHAKGFWGGYFSGFDGGFVEYLGICGEFSRAREVGEQYAASAPAALDTTEARRLSYGRVVPLGNCYFGLQLAYLYQGEPERAADAAAHAHFWYGSLPWDMMLGLVTQFELAMVLTYWPERIDERHRLADTKDRWHGRWYETLGIPYPRLGWLSVFEIEGEWAEARANMPMSAQTLSRGVNLHPRLTLGSIARAQGEPEVAWSVIHELLPDDPASPILRPYWDHARALRLGANLALDGSDLTAARAWLDAYERLLARCGAVIGQSEGQALWARYHWIAGNVERAFTHAERAFQHASMPRQPLALLAAHRLLGELNTDAGRFAAAQDHLNHALALADACQAPYERALTLLAMAELHATNHQPADALSLLDDVRAICTRLDAKPTLARADALAARLIAAPSAPPAFPDGLSPREVDVLRLIAEGMTNQEIAGTLSLSVRTIERHITNLYAKIDARGRADATAYALRHLS